MFSRSRLRKANAGANHNNSSYGSIDKSNGDGDNDDDHMITENTSLLGSDHTAHIATLDRIVNKEMETLPHFINPFCLENSAMLLGYFNIGIALYLLSTPISYYLIDKLDCSSSQYNAYATLITLPWSFKFLFGALSDCIPLYGSRRNSWFFLGWIIYILSSFYLAALGEPGLVQVSLMMFLSTCAYLLADVCADASNVEKSKYETEAIKGAIQASSYSIRSFGSVLGALLGSILYNTTNWGWGLTIAQLFILNGLFPMTTLAPVAWYSLEVKSTRPKPTFTEVFADIWRTVQLKAVWYPMVFIFLYSAFQISNAAWTNFLVEGLEFTDFELGLISIFGALLYFLGMLTFQAFFFNSSWKKIYIITTALGAFFSILQVLLVLRVNQYLGLPDVPFAVGDYALQYFVSGVSYMPMAIMFIMICPEGSEGVTFALLTTISNLGGSVSGDIGTALTYIWDVSNDTIESGDYSGVLKLTILCGLLKLVPLAFLKFQPDSKAEYRVLIDQGITSVTAGMVLLIIVAFSMIFTLGYNIYLIV